LLRERRAGNGRIYLSSWLATYPRDGFFYGHLSWHLSLCEIQAGNWAEALRLYRDAIALDRHSGGPQQKISDAAAFLWRTELAGQPRDTAAWRGLYAYANSALPRPGSGLADLHVLLVHAVMRDDAALNGRARQICQFAAAIAGGESEYPYCTIFADLAIPVADSPAGENGARFSTKAFAATRCSFAITRIASAKRCWRALQYSRTTADDGQVLL
jgi:hypothetical protein